MSFKLSCVFQKFHPEIAKYRQQETTFYDFIDTNYYKSICKDLNLYMFTDGVSVTKSPSTSRKNYEILAKIKLSLEFGMV